MAMENEGFTMESNMFRPGRNYMAEPLSEFELNNFSLRHPELDLPSIESMLNTQYQLLESHKYPDLTVPTSSKAQETLEQIIKELTQKPSPEIFVPQRNPDFLPQQEFTPAYTPPKLDFTSFTPKKDEEEEENQSQSALGEVGEALFSIFNPLEWFTK